MAVDNSGSIARTDVKPEGFNLPLTTFEDLMIEYFAYDYDGNVAICQVNPNLKVAGCLLHVFLVCSKESL